MLPLLFPLPLRITLFRSLKELFGESKVRDEHRRKQQDGQPYDEHPASRRPHVSRHIRDERELFAVHSDNVPVAERPCVLTRRGVAFGEVDLLAVHRLRSHDTVGDELPFICARRRTEDNDVSLLRSAVIGVKEQDVSRLYRGSHAPRTHREDDVAQDGIARVAHARDERQHSAETHRRHGKHRQRGGKRPVPLRQLSSLFSRTHVPCGHIFSLSAGLRRRADLPSGHA